MTDQIKDSILSENVSYLCYHNFKFLPTKSQEQIIHNIAYSKYRRQLYLTPTRYGKSYCIASAICLFVMFNKQKRIKLVSPTYDQSKIIMNYIAEFIIRSDYLSSLVDFDVSNSAERLKKQVSKNRITFKNGCELQLLSAEGTAKRLMGHGADLVIIDESCLIDKTVFNEKIARMLMDSPDSILVEIGNPWDKNNHFYEHYIDPNYTVLEIDYKVAIEEGRFSQEDIEEQRRILTESQFKVLYDAKFPDESENNLISYDDLKHAQRNIVLPKASPTYLLGVDVARFGNDFTVFTYVECYDGLFFVRNIKKYEKQTITQTTGKIIDFIKQNKVDIINLDATGLGSGLFDNINEYLSNNDISDIELNECIFGSKSEDQYYLNFKTDIFMHLSKLFKNKKIIIPNNIYLIDQLSKILYETTSTGKIKINDNQDKSPDFADSLALACYTSNDGVDIAWVTI